MDNNEQKTINAEDLTPVELSDISPQKLTSEGEYSPDYELYSKKPKKNNLPIIMGVGVVLVILVTFLILFLTGYIKF